MSKTNDFSWLAAAAENEKEQRTMEFDRLTVGQLCKALTRIMAENPDAKDFVVRHVEFGGLEAVRVVEVDGGEKQVVLASGR